MSLSRLSVTNIRNISSATLEPGAGINLIVGCNGSGKTSLLEAIYFLGSGRTFRSHAAATDRLIQHGSDMATVFGLLEVSDAQVMLGISRKRDGGREIRINGESSDRVSALAKKLPTLVLGPDTVSLLTGTPLGRRRFLNWGVFHVEPGFDDAWRISERCLKQRNQLLKTGSNTASQLDAWDRELARVAELIHIQRQQYFERFEPVYLAVCREILGSMKVGCRYTRGWDKHSALIDVLRTDRDGDFRRGSTQHGPHRADIAILVDDHPAAQQCSRGELKSLAWCMLIAQGKLQDEAEGSELVYLVDDLASELDSQHRNGITGLLARTRRQIFATGIEIEQLSSGWNGSESVVFHVEHGSFHGSP